MNYLSVLITMSISLLLSACHASQTNNELTSTQASYDSINSLRLSGAMYVIYEQKDTIPTVYISAPKQILDKMYYGEEKGVLSINYNLDYSDKEYDYLNKIHIRIVSPTLQEALAQAGCDLHINSTINTPDSLSLRCSSGGNMKLKGIKTEDCIIIVESGGDIHVDEPLHSKQLTITASSGGEVNLEQTTTTLTKANVSSGAEISINGTTDKALFNAESGGELNADGLTARIVKATASSASKIKCAPTQQLTSAQNSEGKVYAKTNPIEIQNR